MVAVGRSEDSGLSTFYNVAQKKDKKERKKPSRLVFVAQDLHERSPSLFPRLSF